MTIPDGVTRIGDYAFNGCSGLTKVYVSDIGKWCDISFGSGEANPLYYAHSLYRNGELLTALEIPEGVTNVGSYAFSGCSGLTSVTIPNSVTNIGFSAFSGCSGLTSVTIPDSVTSIGEWAFSDCSGLTSVTIPNSVTNIGSSAFYGCSGLTSVKIPNSVTSIGGSAFSGCSGLTSVTIPDSVTSIGSFAFSHCSGLTSVTIPDGVTNIGHEAFRGCSGLTSVTIPDSVTSIGAWAFSGCSGLTSVTIPDGVTRIGDYAFFDCSGLTSVTIPNSVTNIGSGAFSYCSGLRSVKIPNSVTSIGGSAFRGCNGLTSVTIPNSVTNIGYEAFWGCSGLMSVTIPQYVCSYGLSRVFPSAYDSITDVVILDGVESIGDYAFNGCAALTNITIPDSVMSIGHNAFKGCNAIADEDGFFIVHGEVQYYCGPGGDITIPEQANSIGAYAFSGCSGLTSVTIPAGVTNVHSYAFSDCSSLTNVVIGAGVQSIGEYAFDACPNVERVEFTATNLTAIGCHSLPTVPKGEEKREYVLIASSGDVQMLPALDLFSSRFAGWWTLPDGGELLAAAGDIEPFSEYYAHWSGVEIGRIELSIPDSVSMRDDYYRALCGWNWDWTERISRKDLVTAVYDVNGFEIEGWQDLCDVDLYDESGSCVGSEYYEIGPGTYSLKVYPLDSSFCTGEASAAVSVNKYEQWYTCNWEYGSGEEYIDYSFGLKDSDGYDWDDNRWTSEERTIVYPESASVGGYFYARYYGSDYNEHLSLADTRGDIDSYREGDGYFQYREDWPSGNSMTISDAGLYHIYVSISGQAEIDAYWECAYFDLGEGTREYTLSIQPQSFSANTLTAVNCETTYTGDPISPIEKGFSVAVSEPTSYYVENPLLTKAGTYAIRIGAKTSDDLSRCVQPDEGSEWIAHLAYRNAYGNASFDAQDDGKLLYNYTGVVDVVYTVLPRPVTEEQVLIPLPENLTYDGTAKVLSDIVITNDYNGVELVEGVDYDVIYTDNVMPGRATATIVCKGNYTGRFSTDFEIVPADFDISYDEKTGSYVGLSGNIVGYEGVYDGYGHWALGEAAYGETGEATVRYALAENGPYAEDPIIFTNVCDRTVWVELSAPGYNSVTGAVKVVISPRSIENATVTAENVVEYPGCHPELLVDIRDNGLDRLLVKGVDYTATVVNDDAAGITTVTVAGLGNYVGECVAETAYVKSLSSGGVNWQYWPVEDSVWLVSINQSSGALPSVVVIPDEIDGSPVREIPDGFFKGFSTVETVVVGANVTKFGNGVFRGCTSLKYVVFAGDAPSVHPYVFSGAPSDVKVVAAKRDGGWGESWPHGEESRQVAYAPAVSITPFSGKKSGRLAVTIINDGDISGAEVRYTTDGTEPTAASALYERRFTINVTELVSVKAAAFLGGVRVSDVAETRYSPVLNDVLNISNIIAKPGSAPLFFDLDSSNQWWSDETETSYDGTPSMKSGKIGNDSSSWMSATFTGAGVLEFNWKTSCEYDDYGEFFYDHAVCELDGVEVAWLDGVSDGWIREEIQVATTGEHTVKWIYVKDDADDRVYPGEDCVWVDGVKFSYPVYVSFSAGDGSGDAPESIMSSIGYAVVLPGQGSLTYAKHEFIGWSDGETVYAEGSEYVVGASDTTLNAVWREKMLAAPVIAVASVYDEESTVVSINVTDGTSVYYTTDGSAPDAECGTLYVAPFMVTGTTTIKAVAMADDWFASAISETTTTRSWSSLEECLGTEEFSLATGGGANWIGDSTEGCVKTAALGGGWLTATFYGPGVATYLLREGFGGWARHDEVFPDDGVHVLRWEGEALAVKELELLPVVSVSFAVGEDVEGMPPQTVFTAEGREVAIPGGEGLFRAKHMFAGWSDGKRTFAEGEGCLVGADDMEFAAAWTAKTLIPPVIDAPSSYEADSVMVSISSEVGTVIHYTVDGSIPTEESARYEAPFEMSGSFVVKAIAAREDYFASSMAECAVTRPPWMFDECLNAPNLEFTTSEDAAWFRVKGVSQDGYALRSATNLGNRQSSVLSTTVDGAGVIMFMCKVSSEADDETGEAYDGLVFSVDGIDVTDIIGGEIGWTNLIFKVEGDGPHTLSWRYEKDKRDSAGEDCAWVDGVTWKSGSVDDPIPPVASDDDVAAALTGTADANVAANVTNAAQYAAYRAWALSVTNSTTTAQMIKESARTWLSYAFAADALIDKEPTSDDVKIESFTPASTDGKFELTVSVKGVSIGAVPVVEAVLKENLKKVLGIEGAATLSPGAFSPDNIEITFDAPVDGKARFTVSPPADAGKSFFMRVKVK